MFCRSRLFGASALLLVVACDISDPGTAGSNPSVRLSITGADQIGLPGTLLDEPITVRLFDALADRPIRNRTILFHVPAGSGIELEPAQARTDTTGMVSVRARLGTVLGRHRIEVDYDGNPGAPRPLMLETAAQPIITEIAPGQVSGNEPIIIRGQHFAGQASGNDVRIGGLRAAVTVASVTELRVTVPRCLESGPTHVTVRRGSIESQPALLEVAGTGSRHITLQSGEALREPGDVSCLRLEAQSDSARYLIIPLNTAVEGYPNATFQLIAGSGAAIDVYQQRLATRGHAQLMLEERLHALEAALIPAYQARPRPRTEPLARVSVPELGHERDFNVIAAYGLDRVTAVARGIGRSVVIYVDREGYPLSQADIAPLVRRFDDIVFPTALDVYGQTSDLDGNGRVAVLLTPAVNRLTPPGSHGFVSGFFYGCDLLSTDDCPDSNQGEVLYGVMPDPSGEFGIRHSRDFILRILPGVMAHELMHLIHFNERVLVNGLPSMETLWLAEALAHTAEDTVAGVLRSQGDLEAAREMSRENYVRASFFLARAEATSLVPTYGGGTLEERGAGWLLLKYLQAHTGPGVLGQLVQGRGRGSENVTSVTGLEWAPLVRDWAAALYAAGAPEWQGRRLARADFGAFDLGAAITSVSGGGYPLALRRPARSDFLLSIALPSSAAAYVLVDVAPGQPLQLTLADGAGRAFEEGARADIAILRVR